MHRNPEDRRDNVEKIQKNIDSTIRNMEIAEEMISETDNEQMQKDLRRKNKRREAALDGLRKEIQDEAVAREKNYRP